MPNIHSVSQPVYSLHVLAYNSDTDLTSLLNRQQLAAAVSHGRSISKC